MTTEPQNHIQKLENLLELFRECVLVCSRDAVVLAVWGQLPLRLNPTKIAGGALLRQPFPAQYAELVLQKFALSVSSELPQMVVLEINLQNFVEVHFHPIRLNNTTQVAVRIRNSLASQRLAHLYSETLSELEFLEEALSIAYFSLDLSSARFKTSKNFSNIFLNRALRIVDSASFESVSDSKWFTQYFAEMDAQSIELALKRCVSHFEKFEGTFSISLANESSTKLKITLVPHKNNLGVVHLIKGYIQDLTSISQNPQ